ncbi:phosphatidylinositol transfer protein csr1 [Coemansia erecta]|uniref:Phosphatidylinositol transfer protein csr1 n=1 Tax=Coemansia erecta TaxID=147472 RepID=A0A9W7Y6B1_9FUNG|nr:phosphatidylinositol transfer protein csr1 [Coemansia erecta]
MTITDIPNIIDVYKSGSNMDAGTVGHLTDAQERCLKEMWVKVLAHFEATASKPIKVTHSQIQPDSLESAGIAIDDADAVDQWYNANLEQASDIKTQTVRDKMHLDGVREAVVPGSFKPLFSDEQATRTFANTFWQACMLYSSPDCYLLMFLRATSWKVGVAFERLVKSIEWRASQAIDKLMWDGDGSLHHKMMDDGLVLRAGKDKLGNPVVIVRVKLSIPRERANGVAEKFAAYTLEQTAMIARRYGERAALVYDFTGFKRENMDLTFIKTLLNMISESYPQMLNVTILHANSWLFSGFWRIISSWLDPLVAKRTVIAKDINELQAFMDKSEILTDMGGALENEYKYVYPTKEENTKMFDTDERLRAEIELKTAADAFFETTKDWVAKPDVGGYADQARVQAAATFHAAALRLDSFIRARFLAERTA